MKADLCARELDSGAARAECALGTRSTIAMEVNVYNGSFTEDAPLVECSGGVSRALHFGHSNESYAVVEMFPRSAKWQSFHLILTGLHLRDGAFGTLEFWLDEAPLGGMSDIKYS